MTVVGRLVRRHIRGTSRPLATEAQRCPTCHRPWDASKHAGRVCAGCGRQILRGHKFSFGEDGKVRHRHCDRPDSYR
jgi:predicted amidophosphoribosyltransferase